MNLIYLLFALVSGLCFAVQGPINTALGERTNKFLATCVSFFGGMLALGIVLLVKGSCGLGNIAGTEFWKLLGGAYGAYGVCVTVLAIPVLGLALTLTIVQLGQLISAAVIDTFGLFAAAQTAVTPLRLAGIVLTASGILFMYVGKKNDSVRKNRLPMALMALSMGIISAIQSPTNAALSQIVGSIESAFVSFAVGFLCISLVTLLSGAFKKDCFGKQEIRPWMISGGVFGACAILINVVSMPVLGAALLTAAGMLGQLLGGLAIDSFGLLQIKKVPLSARRVVGICLVLLGVGLVSMAKLGTL